MRINITDFNTHETCGHDKNDSELENYLETQHGTSTIEIGSGIRKYMFGS